MGVVYRARDPIINRLVALKTITAGIANDPNLLQRFYREAQSAGGLQHPNIVTVYDMGDEGGVPFIAMELVEGESLEHLIARRSALPVSLKLVYALQACRAFDFAHKRGIVHRDIKPANVMVSKEGTVKVVDFGIARVLESSKTQTGMLIGTFAYMSPEQYQGEHADERSDLWSFGVLLYELMAYQRPFPGESPASLMHGICQVEPKPLREVAADCNAALEAVVYRLLRKLPSERYQSMEDVLLDLDPICRALQAETVIDLVAQARQSVTQGDYSQARDFLRQALQIDPTNIEARTSLEKVNAELRRILIRPKAQQHVEKGRAFLEEGKIQEAKAEAENALQLDSSFTPAQELQQKVQEEFNRAQSIAEWLQNSKQRLAEGMPEEAETLLAKVLELEPANRQAQSLLKQVASEKAERERRLRLLEKMQDARGLWTQQRYEACIELLTGLQKEFPDEDEIQRLLDTVHEDQAEQHRVQTLDKARNLLATGRHEDSKALLIGLRKQFPNDEEIPKLLDDIREDQAKQHRLQTLAEARSCLANRRYDECISLLKKLQSEFPNEDEILRLLNTALEDQREQQKQQGLAETRTLLASRRYDECKKLLAELGKVYPNDSEIPDLLNAVRADQEEQRKLKALAEARDLVAAKRYENAIALLGKLKEDFPSDLNIPKLLESATEDQRQQVRQQRLAEARNLLAAQQYDACNALLAELGKQFPDDGEVRSLLDAVRAGQEEQRRLRILAEARSLLASRQYDECNTLLADLRKQYPDDSEVRGLLEAVRAGQEEQRKLKILAEARSLLASRQYDKSIEMLSALAKEFPGDPDIPKLLQSAVEFQKEQRRRQGITGARSLLAARRYDDCNSLLGDLQKQFPNDKEILGLSDAVRADQEEQRKLKGLAEARELLAARRYDESVAQLTLLANEFSADDEIPRLLATAREGQAEQRRLKGLTDARALLASKRYHESIAVLKELGTQFPNDREIRKLLATADEERAEQDKQQKLTEARTLLAAQKFAESLAVLDALRSVHPKDSVVQKLHKLVQHEQQKQARQERLQRELESLKKLVNEKKYPEVVSRGGALLTEFSGEADLTRLIEFARSQQAQLDQEIRLRKTIEEVKAHAGAGRFPEASRAAQAGLKTFPGNAELASLREQADLQIKKQQTRQDMELRIRDIKIKINREKFSEAIDLAQQSIATLGPNTDLTQLLNSALVEMKAREKKREQERKLEEIRAKALQGNFDDATMALDEAVQTNLIETYDPRLQRLAQEIDSARTAATAGPTAQTPPAAPTLSREYAFLQGTPQPLTPPPVEKTDAEKAPAAQASASQPAISSQPVISPPPPPPAPVIPPAAAAPAAPQTPISKPKEQPASARPVSAPPPKAKEPVRAMSSTSAPVESPRTAVPAKPAESVAAWMKPSVLVASGLVIAIAIWAAAHFMTPSQPKPVPSPVPTATATKPPAPPPVNPLEVQQRSAIDAADKLIAAGDLNGALLKLQQAEKLNGPLTEDIKKRESTTEESMRNSALAALRRQETLLWQQATANVDGNRFDAAKRDLQKILAFGDGGVRKDDARKYLDDVIPRRQQEENLLRQAKQASQSNDPNSLQRAVDLSAQITALNGPRRAEAEQLGADAQVKLHQLEQDALRQQISSLETGARQDLKRGDLSAARQKADQIRNAGGDASALSTEIDKLQAEQIRLAQAEAEFQQAVASYKATGATDKSGLERSRSAFDAIARSNGPRASEAKQYAGAIISKLEALNQPPPAVTSPKPDLAAARAADESAIRALVEQAYPHAFEQRSADALGRIWPDMGTQRHGRYKAAFDGASSIQMQVQIQGNIEISADGSAATVHAAVAEQYTPKGDKPHVSNDQAVFQLQKSGQSWVIKEVR
jgi:serine/threonine-protein kinase